jgi:pyridoxal phosphate enzyme (YggS family)
MLEKSGQLPRDIRWHFIGHLQSNKVKVIVPFVQLIQSVDSLKLLQEINKQAKKAGRVIDCLLQVHIAKEETKFGLDEEELNDLVQTVSRSHFENICIRGLMGMASFTNDMNRVREEMKVLKRQFDKFAISQDSFRILSMGMTSDYKVALEEGSTMIRIGTLLFGERS